MTNERPKDGIVELIQKCLALSKSANEHEAAAALQKAQELLEKYNLDIRAIQSSMDILDAIEMADVPVPLGNDNWRRRLMHVLGQNNFCDTVYVGTELHVLGRSSNVVSVLMMGSWIIQQLDGLATLEAMTYRGALSKRKWRNSFLYGAINRIDQRLKEARNEREQVNENLHALVFDLGKELQGYVQERFPRLRHLSPTARINREAYRRGEVVGGQVSLYGPNRQVREGQHLLE